MEKWISIIRIIDDNTLKLYESCHYCYITMVTHEKLEKWDLLESIDFVEKRHEI